MNMAQAAKKIKEMQTQIDAQDDRIQELEQATNTGDLIKIIAYAQTIHAGALSEGRTEGLVLKEMRDKIEVDVLRTDAVAKQEPA